MDYMFYGCSNLKTLDLSNFDISSVKNMDSMFYDCNNLISLNLNSLFLGVVPTSCYSPIS